MRYAADSLNDEVIEPPCEVCLAAVDLFPLFTLLIVRPLFSKFSPCEVSNNKGSEAGRVGHVALPGVHIYGDPAECHVMCEHSSVGYRIHPPIQLITPLEVWLLIQW